MTYLPFVLLALAVLIDARAQGLLNRLTRQYVPPAAQAQVNVPLHWLYPGLYALLVAVVALAYGWLWLLIGGLLRLALFDAVLNYTKGDFLFYVGESALLDRLLRKISLRGELASILLRVVALAATVVLTLFIAP